jgi:Calpain family cysteine protease
LSAAKRLSWLIVFLFVAAGATSALAEVPGQQRGDPNMNLAGSVRGVHYGSVVGDKPVTPKALFGKDGKPLGTDVKQGGAGDCYLDSTAAAYAEFHPIVIKKIFLDGGQLRTSAGGKPAARFFVKDPQTREFKPGNTTIYLGRAPVDKTGKPVLDKVVDGKAWASQLELAYTKFRNQQGAPKNADVPLDKRNGFAQTGNGGFASQVMQALTGKKAELIDFEPSDREKIWARLKAAQDRNEVVVAGTTTPARLKQRIRDEVAAGRLDGRSKAAKFDEDRWVQAHAYTVWGDRDHPFLVEKDGVRYIRLRNPWGTNAPGGEGKDGIGTIPFDTFVVRYDQLCIGSGSAKGD